ncbi:PREDICTED: protein Simiate isoform X1 [Tarenaya hassleriana]|uniref:protein Simiate isoform X1 n=1 Tax=Tarenaya hassleriana TaxID=28532 RepID=UPI00053C5D46|nr:PREDICTED: protein Simiate isoform X1 [Tarenaya hassleriana]
MENQVTEEPRSAEIENEIELTEQQRHGEAVVVEEEERRQQQQQRREQVREREEDEEKEKHDDERLRMLLLSDVRDLPVRPPSAIDVNFASFFAPGSDSADFFISPFHKFSLRMHPFVVSRYADFMKPGHDQYVYRHANGLCVIGLAPTHIAFKDEGGIIAVDFNVGKSDRSGMKVTGKRKKNAQQFESNTALCKVSTAKDSYIVRCCVKGSLLEVNDRLIKHPELLNSSADREGYIAIIMPKPANWLKNKASLLTLEEYEKRKEPSS